LELGPIGVTLWEGHRENLAIALVLRKDSTQDWSLNWAAGGARS